MALLPNILPATQLPQAAPSTNDLLGAASLGVRRVTNTEQSLLRTEQPNRPAAQTTQIPAVDALLSHYSADRASSAIPPLGASASRGASRQGGNRPTERGASRLRRNVPDTEESSATTVSATTTTTEDPEVKRLSDRRSDLRGMGSEGQGEWTPAELSEGYICEMYNQDTGQKSTMPLKAQDRYCSLPETEYRRYYDDTAIKNKTTTLELEEIQKITRLVKEPTIVGVSQNCTQQLSDINKIIEVKNQCDRPDQLTQQVGNYEGMRKDCLRNRTEYIDIDAEYGFREVRMPTFLEGNPTAQLSNSSNAAMKKVHHDECRRRGEQITHEGFRCLITPDQTQNQANETDITLYNEEIERSLQMQQQGICKGIPTANITVPTLLRSNFTEPDCDAKYYQIGGENNPKGLSGYHPSPFPPKTSPEEDNLQKIKDYCTKMKTQLKTWLEVKDSEWNPIKSSIETNGNKEFNNFTVSQDVNAAQTQLADQLSLRLCQMAVARMPQTARQHRARLKTLLETAGFNATDFPKLNVASFGSNIPNTSWLCNYTASNSETNSQDRPIPLLSICKIKPGSTTECNLHYQSTEVNPCTLNDYGEWLLNNNFWRWLENQSERTVVLTAIGMGAGSVLSLFSIAWVISGICFCTRYATYKKISNTDAAAKNLEARTLLSDRDAEEKRLHDDEAELHHRMNQVAIAPTRREGGDVPLTGWAYGENVLDKFGISADSKNLPEQPGPPVYSENLPEQSAPPAYSENLPEQAGPSTANANWLVNPLAQASPSGDPAFDLEKLMGAESLSYFSPTEKVPFHAYVQWSPPPEYGAEHELMQRVPEGGLILTEQAFDPDDIPEARQKAADLQAEKQAMIAQIGIGEAGGALLERLFAIDAEVIVLDGLMEEIKKVIIDQPTVQALKKQLAKQKQQKRDLGDEITRIRHSFPENIQCEDFYNKNMTLQFEIESTRALLRTFYKDRQKQQRLDRFDEALVEIEKQRREIQNEKRGLLCEQYHVSLHVRQQLARLALCLSVLDKAKKDIEERKAQIIIEIECKPAAMLDTQRITDQQRTGIADMVRVSDEERQQLYKASAMVRLLRAKGSQEEIKKTEKTQREIENKALLLGLQAAAALTVLTKEEKAKKKKEKEEALIAAIPALTARKKTKKNQNIEFDFSSFTQQLPERLQAAFKEQVKAYLGTKPLLSEARKLQFVDALVHYVNEMLQSQPKVPATVTDPALPAGQAELLPADQHKLHAIKSMMSFLSEVDCVEGVIRELASYFTAKLKADVHENIELIKHLDFCKQGKNRKLSRLTISGLNRVAAKLPKTLRTDFMNKMEMFLVNFEQITKKQAIEFSTAFVSLIQEQATPKSALEAETAIDGAEGRPRLQESNIQALLDILLGTIATSKLTPPYAPPTYSPPAGPLPSQSNDANLLDTLLTEDETSQLTQQAQDEAASLIDAVMPEIQACIEDGLCKALQLGFENDALEILKHDEITQEFCSWLPQLLVDASNDKEPNVDVFSRAADVVNKMLSVLSEQWQGRLHNKLVEVASQALESSPDLPVMMLREAGKFQRMKVVTQLSLVIAQALNKHVSLKNQKPGFTPSGEMKIPLTKAHSADMAQSIIDDAARQTARAAVIKEASTLPKEDIRLAKRADVRKRALIKLKFEVGKAGAREVKVDQALERHSNELSRLTQERSQSKYQMGLFSMRDQGVLVIEGENEEKKPDPNGKPIEVKKELVFAKPAYEDV